LSHTASISLQAESHCGFLKNDPQQNHFGCLFSLNSILSTCEEYFSSTLDKSNFTLIIKYFQVFLGLLFLYSKNISCLLNSNLCPLSKSKTSADKKLFSASSQKHQAFQNTAHPTLQGNPINLCQTLLSYFSSTISAK
jgi:hypothetical protein